MKDKMQRGIAELNKIAAEELSGPKRHRHVWASDEKIQRGSEHVFRCTKCPKTKTVKVPDKVDE